MAKENSNLYGESTTLIESFWGRLLQLLNMLFGGQDTSQSAPKQTTNSLTDDGKHEVDNVCVLRGEKLLGALQGESVQLTNEEKASLEGKFFMRAHVDGRWQTVEIDKATFDRVGDKWMNDRAEDFCKAFGVDNKNYDFSGIGANFKGVSSSAVPTKWNRIDFFRGLDTSKNQVPSELQVSDNYTIAVKSFGTKHFTIVDQDEMNKMAGLSAADRQTYLERIFKMPVSPENVSIRTHVPMKIDEDKEIMTGQQLDHIQANMAAEKDSHLNDIGLQSSTKFNLAYEAAEAEQQQQQQHTMGY